MKRFGRVFPWTLAAVLIFCGIAMAANAKLPRIGGREIIASVNEEPVTMEEFRRSLASLHEGKKEKESGAKRDYFDLLRRMINAKLILQEARNIGLDALPEVKDNIDAYASQTLRGILLSRQVRNVRPDEREVDKAYKESIREMKIRSYLFGKEEDAAQAKEEIHAGGVFDNVMKRYVSEGKAKGNEEGSFMKWRDLLPEISEAVSKMKEGEISPVLKVSEGQKGQSAFTILKLGETRFPESPEARDLAFKGVLQRRRFEAINKYGETLKKKYVKIRKKTLDGLDYESKDPGLEKLLADKRVVAEIRGEKPILVSDVSQAIREKFYHGIERAAGGKKVNKEKSEVLNEMLLKRLLAKEAFRKKIDKTPEYKGRLEAYRAEVLFGTFVEKVIDREIRLDDAAIRKYYDEHPKEFLSPERRRLLDLAFGKREDAADALEKLRKGADFKWVKGNAPGQVDETSKNGGLPQGWGDYVQKDLPDGIREIVSGAGSGEFRLFHSPEGQFFVLYVQEVIPAQRYAYDKVKDSIANEIFRKEQQKSLEGWIEKLRAASEIKIFATQEEMEKIFVHSGGGAAKP